jgi:putative Holliday junction resolvase
MKRLGIDFGSKRVGIAVSDEEGKIAFPKTIFKNDAMLAGAIKELSMTEHVGEIVIGESFAEAANPIMIDIKRFADQIRESTGLPVAFQKEYMTSVEARRPLDGKKSLIARKTKQDAIGKVDAAAAALILQRYLDTINKK